MAYSKKFDTQAQKTTPKKVPKKETVFCHQV